MEAECRRIDAFEVWCWRRLLRVSWLQGDPTSPSYRKSVLSVHWKDWYWSWNSSTLAPWCEELTHWKRAWCWARLRAGDDRVWDGWMASPTQWVWVCVNSRSWWWTVKSGVLQSMGLQIVRYNWMTELNWGKMWLFIGKTAAKPPTFWPPDVKSWLTGKDPDAGKDGRQRITGQQRIRWLDSITDTNDMNLNKFGEIVEAEEPGML